MSNNYDRLRTLVTLAQAGNQDVFEEIYRLTHPIMTLQASVILQDDDEVQDVVQEAFIRIWNSIDRVGEPQYFVPWVKKVTTNLSLTYLKRRREFTSADILLQVESNSEPIADVLDDYVELEGSNDIQSLLNELDPIIGTTLYLRYFKGLYLKEIALQLQIPEGTVKSRLHSGKRQLKKLMKKDKRYQNFFGGLLPVGVVLTEKSGSNVALASTGTKVVGGVALTSVACAVSVTAFYSDVTDKDVTAFAPFSTVTEVTDSTLPAMELVGYDDTALSVLVSDADSGVDFGRVYCELADGRLIGPSSVDTQTGQVDFITTGDDVLVYVYDLAGNSVCHQLVVE